MGALGVRFPLTTQIKLGTAVITDPRPPSDLFLSGCRYYNLVSGLLKYHVSYR